MSHFKIQKIRSVKIVQYNRDHEVFCFDFRNVIAKTQSQCSESDEKGCKTLNTKIKFKTIIQFTIKVIR